MSPEPTEKDEIVSITALSTPVKSKGKRQRKTPLYFRTRKRTWFKQGIPQTPTKIPIIIEDSRKEQEKEVPLEKTEEEETSKQDSPKSPITYVRRPITRSASRKQVKQPLTQARLQVSKLNLDLAFLKRCKEFAIILARKLGHWIFCPIYLMCKVRSSHSTCPRR